MSPDAAAADAAAAVRAALVATGEPWQEASRGAETRFSVTLPGEHKLRTEVHLALGPSGLRTSAFVVRCPDAERERVWRWLLERNARAYGVAFSVDGAGDVYLVGRWPLSAVTPEDVDRLLGSVLALADSSFDPLLRLGFADAIRDEWRWRLARGEPTSNLAAFEDLRPERPGP